MFKLKTEAFLMIALSDELKTIAMILEFFLFLPNGLFLLSSAMFRLVTDNDQTIGDFH